jgi:hypothetical protein
MYLACGEKMGLVANFLLKFILGASIVEECYR